MPVYFFLLFNSALDPPFDDEHIFVPPYLFRLLLPRYISLGLICFCFGGSSFLYFGISLLVQGWAKGCVFFNYWSQEVRYIVVIIGWNWIEISVSLLRGFFFL